MTDTLTPEQRRRCMSANRGADTSPELVVRRLLRSMGYHYRLHAPDLPGKPDIVFRSRRKVIFVHGCYWHRHNCRKGRSTPSTRTAFWRRKFESNRRRDRLNRAKLRRRGWSVLTIWECQLTPGHLENLVNRLFQFMVYDKRV
jgi:DNA mismatch endonuclease (patch repair protein)